MFRESERKNIFSVCVRCGSRQLDRQLNMQRWSNRNKNSAELNVMRKLEVYLELDIWRYNEKYTARIIYKALYMRRNKQKVRLEKIY